MLIHLDENSNFPSILDAKTFYFTTIWILLINKEIMDLKHSSRLMKHPVKFVYGILRITTLCSGTYREVTLDYPTLMKTLGSKHKVGEFERRLTDWYPSSSHISLCLSLRVYSRDGQMIWIFLNFLASMTSVKYKIFSIFKLVEKWLSG